MKSERSPAFSKAWRSLSRSVQRPTALLTVTASLVLSACGSRGPATVAAESAGPPEAYGFVLGANDSMPVARARVWTSPPTDDTVTDSTGYWSIKEGIVPGRYMVLAEFAGEQGSVARVDLKAGTSERVVVMLGSKTTPWPPPIVLDKKLPVVNNGPKVIRPH